MLETWSACMGIVLKGASAAAPGVSRVGRQFGLRQPWLRRRGRVFVSLLSATSPVRLTECQRPPSKGSRYRMSVFRESGLPRLSAVDHDFR